MWLQDFLLAHALTHVLACTRAHSQAHACTCHCIASHGTTWYHTVRHCSTRHGTAQNCTALRQRTGFEDLRVEVLAHDDVKRPVYFFVLIRIKSERIEVMIYLLFINVLGPCVRRCASAWCAWCACARTCGQAGGRASRRCTVLHALHALHALDLRAERSSISEISSIVGSMSL